MKSEHTLVFILRNGLLKDSFEGFEVKERIDGVVYKVNEGLAAGDGVLDEWDYCEHDPYVVIPCYNRVGEDAEGDEEGGLEEQHDCKGYKPLMSSELGWALQVGLGLYWGH